MKTPLEITFLGMSPSPTVETAIERWLERMENVYDRIQHCHVWIEIPHHHQQRGGEFEVRLVVAIPGRDLVVSHQHEDVYLAVADAFTAARRQLLDQARIRREHHAA
jgi:ribosome-associated translation inhibitor RaiA